MTGAITSLILSSLASAADHAPAMSAEDEKIILILTITGGLTAALILGYITQRLGLSPIVGYLLAGVAVGPFTPGFVADHHLAEQLAEIGVILLMFGVGLHFHLKELLAVRRVAIPGAIGQSLFATGLGMLAAWGFGWGLTAGVIYGLAISVASTVVLIRVLADNDDLHTPSGHIVVGWLVVEDLFTVLVLVLLPAMFGGEKVPLSQMPMVLGLALLKIGLLVGFTFIVGARVIPWLLARVAATRSRELFTLTILVVALGIAVGSAKLFGASMALGAFLAGMVVGRSDFSLRAAAEALPMRDAFAVLFFVSVGMLFDPMQMIESPSIVLATLAIVLIGKPLAALTIVLVMRYPVRVALAVAVALAQIGEFSFILAALGKNLNIMEDAAINGLVAAAIVSISINPLLYRLVEPLEKWLARRPSLSRWFQPKTATSPASDADAHEDESDPRYRAIVVGYGPVGQTLARLLIENEIQPTIIEMNLETVKRLRREGLRAVYGDATHRETLASAGVANCASFFLTSSNSHGAQEVIQLAREINPRIRVVARTDYLRERTVLLEAGANRVFSGEGEVALAMDEYLLQELGATPEQIDRERERLQADLFGKRTQAKPPEEPPANKPDSQQEPAKSEP